MSETTDVATETEQEPATPDPSDPATAAENARAQLAQSEARYRASLDRQRQLETRATAAEQEVQTTRQERAVSDFTAISSGLDAVQARAAQAQGELRAAMEGGDFSRVGELNLELGRLGARMETLERGKQEMERGRQEALRQPVQQEPQRFQAAAPDPIEADLSQRSPAAAAWIRSHADTDGKPRFYTDQAFNARVVRADAKAFGSGLDRDTPEYFDFVNREVGMVAQSPAPQPTQQAQQPRSVPTAAPVRQAASYTDNSRRSGGDGQIPAAAVTYAKTVLGLTKPEQIADYWKESRRMARDGEFKTSDPWAGAR